MQNTTTLENPLEWHALEEEEIFSRIQTSRDGLNADEAARRLAQFGPNILPAKKPPGIFAILLHQFASPLIYILLAAGLISLFIGDLKDAGFIFLVVAVNAVIGFVQEWKAEKSALQLQSLLRVMARVRRSGAWHTVPADEIVIGDAVALESGNRVPADLRLLHGAQLTIDESLLTGESAAVEKTIRVVEPDIPIGDRRNMAYAGSTVVTGRGCGIVVGTGSGTEVGKIAGAVSGTEAAKPPLLIRMEDFSRKVGILIIAASMIVAGIAFYQGTPPIDVFFLAVALVVSAIPEGLPVAITVALSIAASRMAKRNVIVRKLAAVESLGSCTTIATDKTGTLTVNQQTAHIILLPSGERAELTGAGYFPDGTITGSGGEPLSESVRTAVSRLATAAVICNEGSLFPQDGEWIHHGDAMDVAFLALGYKAGFDPDSVRNSVIRVAEVPFESETMYAASYYREDTKTIDAPIRVAAKGAVEALIPFCRAMKSPAGDLPIDPRAIEQQLHALMEEGYRVLGVAEGSTPSKPHGSPYLDTVQPDLVFLGLVGFIDPLRPDVKESVKTAHEAGVDVVMITGDHPGTALTIAKELTIARSIEEVMTGQQVEALGDPSLPSYASAIEQVRVFARVTPLQKRDIVNALVRRGHFVAVTGDGVNDAPALRRANIGVAMGSGTDVAKETASMIVTDDNFSSIVAGVEEGRFAYDNIRKVTYLLISTGLSEVILFILSLLAGLPIPLLAVQLLWLNLVTNGIQGVALAFEAGEKGAMQRKPRSPDEGVFNPLMVKESLLSGCTIGIAAFIAFHLLLAQGTDLFMARNLLLLLMVLFENFHVFNCRSEYLSAFLVPLRNNYFLVLGVLVMQGMHILSLQVPVMQDLLGLAPVTPFQWLVCVAGASSVLAVMELFKWVNFRMMPGGPEPPVRVV